MPRACAVFYVPKRNQHLIRSSLPTSHGFRPLPREGSEEIVNPLMVAPGGKSEFVMLFEFVATQDVSPYLCIEEALKFRRDVCGGETKIMKHCEDISNEAGRLGAKILGTEIMQNEEETLTKCSMTNLRLPLEIGEGEGEIPERDTIPFAIWATARLAEEHDIYSPVFIHAGSFWVRYLSTLYFFLALHMFLESITLRTCLSFGIIPKQAELIPKPSRPDGVGRSILRWRIMPKVRRYSR